MVADGAATLTSVTLTHNGNSSPNTPLSLISTTNPSGGGSPDPYARFSRTYNIGGTHDVQESFEIQASANRSILFYLQWRIQISRTGFPFFNTLVDARAQSVVRDGKDTLNFFFVGGISDQLVSSSLGGNDNYTTAVFGGRPNIIYICEVEPGTFSFPANLTFIGGNVGTLANPSPIFDLSINGIAPLVLQGA